jgi:hypothetical protein
VFFFPLIHHLQMKDAVLKSCINFNAFCIGIFQKIEDFEGGGGVFIFCAWSSYIGVIHFLKSTNKLCVTHVISVLFYDKMRLLTYIEICILYCIKGLVRPLQVLIYILKTSRSQSVLCGSKGIHDQFLGDLWMHFSNGYFEVHLFF